uniref:Uncharacterized protein n=1 Tax=Timema genevievae TaxID=629358 RepID=A0A7R9PS65_TIMGE|nr:unnamed protein product [Timema genevievae]
MVCLAADGRSGIVLKVEQCVLPDSLTHQVLTDTRMSQHPTHVWETDYRSKGPSCLIRKTDYRSKGPFSCLVRKTDYRSKGPSCLVRKTDYRSKGPSCLVRETDYRPKGPSCLVRKTDYRSKGPSCLVRETDYRPKGPFSCLVRETDYRSKGPSCLVRKTDYRSKGPSCLVRKTDYRSKGPSCLVRKTYYRCSASDVMTTLQLVVALVAALASAGADTEELTNQDVDIGSSGQDSLNLLVAPPLDNHLHIAHGLESGLDTFITGLDWTRRQRALSTPARPNLTWDSRAQYQNSRCTNLTEHTRTRGSKASGSARRPGFQCRSGSSHGIYCGTVPLPPNTPVLTASIDHEGQDVGLVWSGFPVRGSFGIRGPVGCTELISNLTCRETGYQESTVVWVVVTIGIISTSLFRDSRGDIVAVPRGRRGDIVTIQRQKGRYCQCSENRRGDIVTIQRQKGRYCQCSEAGGGILSLLRGRRGDIVTVQRQEGRYCHCSEAGGVILSVLL